jgi:hypothetical protein
VIPHLRLIICSKFYQYSHGASSIGLAAIANLTLFKTLSDFSIKYASFVKFRINYQEIEKIIEEENIIYPNELWIIGFAGLG